VANGTPAALRDRYRLAYEALPEGLERLLDAGCNSAESTGWYRQKAKHVFGIDPSETAIARGRAAFPDLDLRVGSLEALPYPDGQFDAVVCLDVLEHVEDELQALNELHRVLAPGGLLVLSTPHRGAFSILDPVNYPPRFGGVLKRRAPRLYRRLVATSRDLDEHGAPAWETVPYHRHYGLGELLALLERSNFDHEFKVELVRRTGLLAYPLAQNVDYVATFVTARTRLSLGGAVRAMRALGDLEFRMPAGRLAYCLALVVRKAGAQGAAAQRG
jgi:SAM-dependent methyltransferase